MKLSCIGLSSLIGSRVSPRSVAVCLSSSPSSSLPTGKRPPNIMKERRPRRPSIQRSFTCAQVIVVAVRCVCVARTFVDLSQPQWMTMARHRKSTEETPNKKSREDVLVEQ